MSEDINGGKNIDQEVLTFQNKNYYERLGLGRTATTEEIKDAFRRLLKEYHPDKNPGESKKSELTWLLIEAQKALTNPDTRATYDKKLDSGATRANSSPRPERPTPPNEPNYEFWEEVRKSQARRNSTSEPPKGTPSEQQKWYEAWAEEQKVKRAQEEERRQQEAAEHLRHMETWCSSVLHVTVDVESTNRSNDLFFKYVLSALYAGDLTLKGTGYGVGFGSPPSIDIFANVTIRKSPIGALAFDTDEHGRRIVYLPDANRLTEEIMRQLKEVLIPTLKRDYTLLHRAESVMEKWTFVQKTLHGKIGTLPTSNTTLSYDIVDVLYEYTVANKEKIDATPIHTRRNFMLNFYMHKQDDSVGAFFIDVGSNTLRNRGKLRQFLDANLPI